MYRDKGEKYKLTHNETRYLLSGIDLSELFLLISRLWRLGIQVDKRAFLDEVIPRIIRHNVHKFGRIPDADELKLSILTIFLPDYYYRPLINELREKVKALKGESK